MASISGALGKRKRDDELQKERTEGSFGRYFTSNKTVSIYVGSGRELYIINEDLICDKVPFFRAAFKGEFMEGQEKKMDLPEESTTTFEYFIEWLYTGSLGRCNICFSRSPKPKKVNSPEHGLQWCYLWFYADKLNLDRLAQEAFYKYLTCVNSYLTAKSREKVVGFICDKMPETSLFFTHLVRKMLEMVFRYGQNNKWRASTEMKSERFRHVVMTAITDHVGIIDVGACKDSFCRLHSRATHLLNEPSVYSQWRGLWSDESK